MSNNNRWLSFDPTIHAGHIIILVGFISTTIGSWYVTQLKIENLESQNRLRIQEIRSTNARIEEMRRERNMAFEKLRDDMNRWFMTLNDKLDRKQDK